MIFNDMQDCLERSPIIASIHENQWQKVLTSPVEVIFHLKAKLLNIKKNIEEAHKHNKRIFVHIDLADGIGKDEAGIDYLAACGVDGIISTRGPLIRHANQIGLITVQRFFVLDSQGIQSIFNMLESSHPHYIEIMPGIADKIIRRFSEGSFPIIAGGLIETKQEVTSALSSGAVAVSTGTEELWHLV
ncbi:MAG: glycerol-3-phosphate responsive antiterminator [Clostridia bacterium]|nr:glycerol-3-phosphate responsive antiterminator [Clostridia bacterium]